MADAAGWVPGGLGGVGRGVVMARCDPVMAEFVPSLVPGYWVCRCGCGCTVVCRGCVPHASPMVPWRLCRVHRAMVQAGQVRCENGYLVPVAPTGAGADDYSSE